MTTVTVTPVSAPTAIPPQGGNVPVLVPVNAPVEEKKVVKRPNPKMFSLKPAINIIKTGSVVETLTDIYPTRDQDPNVKADSDDSNPMGFIESNFISVEKTLTIVNQAQFQCGNDIYIRVEVLGENCSGWVTVYSVSAFKEWQWAIPMKRAKTVKDAFDGMFKVIVSA